MLNDQWQGWLNVRVALLLLLTSYFIRHLRTHSAPNYLYREVHGAYQLTIFSMHVAPIVALRLRMPGQPLFAGLSCVTWIAWSWAQRRPMSFPNTSLSALELAALGADLSPLRLAGLLWLQGLIVVGFWAGIIIAACTGALSFLPMDRHLRRLGLLGTLCDPSACTDFLRPGVLGHLMLQSCFAACLLPHVGESWNGAGAAAEMGKIALGYAAIAVVGAAALPPYRLPYQLGLVPEWARVVARLGIAEGIEG